MMSLPGWSHFLYCHFRFWWYRFPWYYFQKWSHIRHSTQTAQKRQRLELQRFIVYLCENSNNHSVVYTGGQIETDSNLFLWTQTPMQRSQYKWRLQTLCIIIKQLQYEIVRNVYNWHFQLSIRNRVWIKVFSLYGFSHPFFILFLVFIMPDDKDTLFLIVIWAEWSRCCWFPNWIYFFSTEPPSTSWFRSWLVMLNTCNHRTVLD